MSQERLGELLGLTFQRVQKHESGADRLGSSRLYEAARALETEVGDFFDDLAAERERLAVNAIVAHDPRPDDADEMRTPPRRLIGA